MDILLHDIPLRTSDMNIIGTIPSANPKNTEKDIIDYLAVSAPDINFQCESWNKTSNYTTFKITFPLQMPPTCIIRIYGHKMLEYEVSDSVKIFRNR